MRTTRSTVVLVALMLLTALIAQGETFTCAYCKKPITQGEYITENNRYYHKSCYYDHVALRCAICGKVIDGQYITQDGKSYHDACFKSYVAERCTYCDKVLMGQYLTTFWGESYCAEHKGKAPECMYCGRLIGDRHNRGGKTYDDGRQVCNLCLQTAVNSQAEAEQLRDEAKERLSRAGIRIDVDDIPIHLVDRDELGEEFGGDVSHNSAFCKKDFHTFFGKEISKRYNIYILNGMPRMHFVAAVAHELMHVWQYEHAPSGNSEQLCEGSCNYASMLVLKQIGGEEMEYQIKVIEDDPTPIYGRGYQRVKKLVEAVGISGWLQHLRTERGFPAGY